MNFEKHVVTVSDMVGVATALGDAALAGDFDEARFLAELLARKATRAGYADVALAAARLSEELGPPGTVPTGYYGASILRIANRLDAIGFTPL